MRIIGTSFDPTVVPPHPAGEVVDYSLARRALLADVRRGLVATTDVCDAHPELARAARNIGEERDTPCPICSHETLRWVRYVFGDELKRRSGSVVYPAEWMSELVASHDQFTCYVVECCIDCSWNHLVRSYSAGRRFAPSSPQRTSRQG
jgi:Family of unknown function (DUF5318)